MTVYVRDKVLSALATGPKTRRQIGSVVLSHERNIERVMGKLQTVGYVSIVGKTENGGYKLNFVKAMELLEKDEGVDIDSDDIDVLDEDLEEEEW